MGIVIQTVIIGAIVVAILAAFTLIMRWGMRAKDEAGLAADRMHERNRLDTETIAALVVDRDVWKQRADVAKAQLGAATVRLAAAEKKRNEALRDERAHVVESIQNSTAAGAARIGNAILSRPLPSMPKANHASPGDGDSKAAAVPVAGPAKRST